ncbi:MAG: peroxiredoxin family protein [Acidobacteria bacterium]|nr:peroxiredoxin family protein [Acidobacteriota bacterium]MYK87964.1 peroxiredoxin family protein [Acidobacteriota bacterium]
MRDSSDQLNQFDIQYFMISVDDAETNRRFAESLDANFPILSDPGRGVADAYGVMNAAWSMPNRWTFIIGPDGKILRIDKQVSMSRAGRELVAHLSELGVPRK